jgi:hypothetical protein
MIISLIVRNNFPSIATILLLSAISIFAQDSTKIIIESNLTIEKNNLSSENIVNSKSGIKPLLELRTKREWIPSSLNRTANKTSMLNLKKKEPNFIDSDLFLIVVGSAVAFGATAAYLKFEADDSYDKYKLTNDKKYKDRTDSYDLYSGIALGVMEINFGYLIYKFLTD